MTSGLMSSLLYLLLFWCHGSSSKSHSGIGRAYGNGNLEVNVGGDPLNEGNDVRRQLQIASNILDAEEQIAQKALEYSAMMTVYSNCGNYSNLTRLPNGRSSYSRRAGWGDFTLDSWYGVELDDDGFVNKLDLTGAKLRCPIPSEIGE